MLTFYFISPVEVLELDVDLEDPGPNPCSHACVVVLELDSNLKNQVQNPGQT